MIVTIFDIAENFGLMWLIWSQLRSQYVVAEILILIEGL